MVKEISGDLITNSKTKFGIVAARFNDFITSKLLEGAIDAIKRHGGDEKNIEVVWVPGAFEIPFATNKMVKSKKYDAIICLGAVIKGSTAHFEYVAGEASKGIGQISANAEIPVIFGVLTTDSIEQAVERAGTKMGNKGAEVAVSAIEMVNVNKLIS